MTLPTGTAIVIDAGLVRFWCHDRPPRVPENSFDDEEVQRSVENAVDFRIEGKDAERAGRDYDRQWHPLYLFDIPAVFA